MAKKTILLTIFAIYTLSFYNQNPANFEIISSTILLSSRGFLFSSSIYCELNLYFDD